MAKIFKTPGVYVQEISIFPPSIAQVETAIPAFIGYTEKAESNGISLLNQPTKIRSFVEFREYFGESFTPRFDLVPKIPQDTKPIRIENQEFSLQIKPLQRAYLYHALLDFFSNSGGTCFIVSVGTYGGKDSLEIKKEELLGTSFSPNGQPIIGGLKAMENATEPSLLLIPDAVALEDDCYEVYRAMLGHCATERNRFSIFDIYDGYKLPEDCIENFRNKTGTNHLSYGAAYYPWLDRPTGYLEVSFKNLDSSINLSAILPEVKAKEFLTSDPMPEGKMLHQGLLAISRTYVEILQAIKEQLKSAPPSGAVAGVYSLMDNTRGVWKAPANISVNGFEKPSIVISKENQENLNTGGASGKSINAIRSFIGKGILIWGARTLAGNDNEWRYVAVRRTFLMVEESIQNSLNQFVFEPNDANTWTRIRVMVENFLSSLWRQGTLAGSKPDHSFYVRIGLGQTMTSQDILDGKMIVEIGMALVRPAEFIILRLNLKMMAS